MTTCLLAIAITGGVAGAVGVVIGCLLAMASREDADMHTSPTEWPSRDAAIRFIQRPWDAP